MKNSFSNSNQSGKRRVGFAFILAVALGSCVITELRAQVVVVPNVLATTNGNSSGTGSGSAEVHAMTIYDASQFGALSGPSFLIQIARRPDTSSSPTGPRTATQRIYVSTTSRSVAGMSTTFSQNTGTNRTLVFDGTETLSSQNLPGPGNTRQFDIGGHPFTTPFLYDPADGNLLVEAQSTNSGSELQWDQVMSGSDSSVRTVLAFGSATAPTGTIAGSAVHQLTFAAPAVATIRASQVEVCWNSQSNVTYQVQYRSDLTTNLWASLGGCIRSTNSTSCVVDPIGVGQPQRFYRVLLTNCVP